MLNLSPLSVIQLAKEEYDFNVIFFLRTAHDQRLPRSCSFNEISRGCVVSTDRIFVAHQPIVGPLSHMYKVRNAGCCRACRRRVCHSACSQARCTEEAMGSWWENPRPQTHTHTQKKKCGFIASLGQRADGVSLPHGTIISWALSTERNMAWRQRGRGRAKDRHDGAETQSGNTTRWGRHGGKTFDNVLHVVFH